MVHPFKLASIPNVIFGTGKLKALPQLLLQYGEKVLVVTGRSSFITSYGAVDLFQDMSFLGADFQFVHVGGEPSPDVIDTAVEKYRDWRPSVVVAIGGGSVVDAGKAIAAMLCEAGSVKDFLEDVGTKQPSGKKVPFIAVPTTSGTGSEATKNAVISQRGIDGFKKSLRHDNYVPDYAIIDPLLSVYCPSGITAASGLDATTQLLEAYLSSKSTPFTDVLALDGLERILKNIETAVFDGENVPARSEMSYAAFLSGVALANAGLGVVHGFAQPLGSMFPVPHGIVCGNLMGPANRLTIEKLKYSEDKQTLEKYIKVARLIFTEGTDDDAVEKLIAYFEHLIETFKLPRLSKFGINENSIDEIVKETSLKNHPIKLTKDELVWILRQRI